MFIWRNGETVIRGFSRVPLYIWFLYKGIILQIFIARLRMRKKKTGGEPASGGTVCKADLFSVSESGKQPCKSLRCQRRHYRYGDLEAWDSDKREKRSDPGEEWSYEMCWLRKTLSWPGLRMQFMLCWRRVPMCVPIVQTATRCWESSIPRHCVSCTAILMRRISQTSGNPGWTALSRKTVNT